MTEIFAIKKVFKDFTKKVFVIAEIGVNHEGNIDKCIKLIDSAHDAGADAIKIQTINPDENYAKDTESFKIFSKSRLSNSDIERVFDYCGSKKIKIFSTIGDLKTLNHISNFNPYAFKISSGLLNNTPLILEILKRKKPIIISTGMASQTDLRNLKLILTKKPVGVCVLHCISMYPTPKNLLCMNYIRYLKKYFNCPIGYSDHTKDYLIPAYAVASGAVLIEKHFTFDSNRKGYDHNISFNKLKFEKMIREIRKVEQILSTNDLLKTKKELRKANARYIVANRNLREGQVIKYEHLGFKRINLKNFSKKIIEPSDYNLLLGKKLKKSVSVDQPIKKNDFF